MSRQSILIGTVAVVALCALKVNAQLPIYWQGGTGTFTDMNYTDGTNVNLAPQPTDFVFLGDTGTVTYSGFGVGVGRIRIGHTQTTEPGSATLTVTGGAVVQANNDALLTGVANAGIQVGAAHNGVLNIDDGATVQTNRLVVLGAGSNVNRSGTLNVTNGGILNVLDGNLNMADGTGSQNGLQGILNISGADSSITVSGPGADLVLGPRAAVATYTQTEGTVTVNDLIEVGTPAGTSTGTTLNISGGTLTTGTGAGANAGNFFVGRGATVNATVNISGTAIVNVGNRFLMGGSSTVVDGFATGATTNHSGGTLTTDLDIRVADAFASATSDATYNLSGTGVINSTTGGIVGRQGIGRFFQTGGEANFNGALSIGNREAAVLATNGLYEISAGDMNVTTALNVAPNGTGELRIVGDDATIDLTGDFSVNSTINGTGMLAFELETGDLLSQINVTGAATFNAGSILALDVSNSAPTQMSYDLLTAASIVDSGIDFNGPAGWGYEIVAGGLGQILRIADGLGPDLPGDHNLDGVVDAADYVAWRKLNIGGNQGYDDFVEHFGEPAPGAGGGGQVPEPTAACMLMLAGLLGISSRQCRRRG